MSPSVHSRRPPYLIMPLVFSQGSPSSAPSPPPIIGSPSVRELIAQVEATSRVPFWRDPQPVQPRRSLYHTLSRILVDDLRSEEELSIIYTSDSSNDNSDQESISRTPTSKSRLSSPILRCTLVRELVSFVESFDLQRPVAYPLLGSIFTTSK